MVTGIQQIPASRTFDVNALPDILEYEGEFGAELLLFLPFCSWLSQTGLLKGRRVKTYRGMTCFYRHLDCLEILEKAEPRHYVPPQRRPEWLPIRDEHCFDGAGCTPFHAYGDMRNLFENEPLHAVVNATARPLVIIHNKHNREWGKAPVNHIPLDALDALLARLEKDFTVVYVRHEMLSQPSFSADHNTPELFDDDSVLSRHPEVLRFQDLFAIYRQRGGPDDVNTFKNALFSRCHRFISSQGGGAHHISMFSGSLVVILHRQGQEDRWAYGDGYYGFLAPVPPSRAICATVEEVVNASKLFLGSTVSDGRLVLSRQARRDMPMYSPWRFCDSAESIEKEQQ